MNTHPSATPSVPQDYALFVGLDWADEHHVLSVCAPGASTIEHATLEQTPEALARWANALRQRCPNGRIAVCLEQSRGALIAGLMAYEHLVLYPVNPKSAARFRQALYPSGSKDDPTDADLLLELVLKHRDRLRAWQPDTPETRQLALLCEQRRGFVDQRTAFTNELLAHLKAIFPQACKLVGEHLASPMATDFLSRWPTLAAVQAARPAALRQFYYGHNSRNPDLLDERLALVKSAVPLTTDAALLAAHSCYSGIAPITEKSGRTEWVHLRWSCPKFLRQSWHEFANHSRKYSTWANACYEHLRQKMDHHEAVRKLAYLWQRIVWRMWQNRELYDEARYLRNLQARGLEPYTNLEAETT